MPPILHDRLPVAPWMAEHTLRLPGTTPIDPADWLQRDEVFAEQMAYRDALIAEREAEVHALAARRRGRGRRTARRRARAISTALPATSATPARCAGPTACWSRSTARR